MSFRIVVLLLTAVLFVGIVLSCKKGAVAPTTTGTDTTTTTTTPPVIPDNKDDTLGALQLVFAPDTGIRAGFKPHFSQVVFPTTNDGYLLDDYFFNQVYLRKTTDGGLTWSVNKPLPGANRRIQFMTATNGFSYKPEIPGEILGNTANSGDSWKGWFSSNLTYTIVRKISFLSDTALYFVTLAGEFVKISKPLGSFSVKKVAMVPTTYDCNDLFFTSASEGWVTTGTDFFSGKGGLILHTADGGLNWETQYTGDKENLQGLCFTDNKHGWLPGGKGYLLRTTDGVHWEKVQVQVNTPYPVTPAKLVFTDASTGFMSSGNEFFKTSDGGSTWTRLVKFGKNTIYDFCYNSPGLLRIITNDKLYKLQL